MCLSRCSGVPRPTRLRCMTALPSWFRVPVHDAHRKRIHAGQTETLAFRGPVPDPALTTDPQGVLQRVVRLAPVLPDSGPAPHVGIERPFDDGQCPFGLSGFPHRDGRIVPARTGRQPPGNPAWRHLAGTHRCRASQPIWPTVDEGLFPDLAPDQTFGFLRNAFGIEDMEAPGFQVADAGNETMARQREHPGGKYGSLTPGTPCGSAPVFLPALPCRM